MKIDYHKLAIFCTVVAGISSGMTIWFYWYTDERRIAVMAWLALFIQGTAPMMFFVFAASISVMLGMLIGSWSSRNQ